jgi:hypothetical protein
MSDIINKENNLLIMDKIIDEKVKEEFYKPKESSILSDEKDEDETIQNETSPNSPFLSNYESNQSCEKLNDISNISIDKTVSPFMSYFLCNEKYIKEKEPEGYNYQKKSRNFILKNNLMNFNEISIENVDLNKVNDILKDIEYLEKNLNNTFFNISLNNVNKDNSNSVNFPKDQPTEKNDCNIESNNLNFCLIDYKFEGK